MERYKSGSVDWLMFTDGRDYRAGIISADWHVSLGNMPPGAEGGTAAMARMQSEIKKPCPRNSSAGPTVSCIQQNFFHRAANYGADELGDVPSPFPQKLNTAMIHKNPASDAGALGHTSLDIVAEFRRTHTDKRSQYTRIYARIK